MNWDRIQGNWKQLAGSVHEQWGRLTRDDLAVIDGRREQLSGKLQQRYGIARDEAERQLRAWEDYVDQHWFR
ncbi:MAG TPA: CsbD family protein [Roseateles sp.]|nr:CsbD family protein [Roseateles sp.]